jgi:outer membrane lipase/esterase
MGWRARPAAARRSGLIGKPGSIVFGVFMKFKVDVVRSVVSAGLAVGLLASCGGGTQIEAFVPKRVIAFGDEASYIQGDGKKYTVNGVVFDTTVTPPVAQPGVLECSTNPVWVQVLGYTHGIAFPGCPTAGYAVVGKMYAQPGHTVGQVVGQVDQFFADGFAFASNDLVTVMAGTNDVLFQYNRLDTEGASRDALITAVRQAGVALGAQVVRITDRGAKVVVSTIPSLSLSPFATAQELAHPGQGRAAFLNELTTEFNNRLRLKLEDVRDGGHAVGLILVDELVLSMARVPTSYPPLTNVTLVACNVALPNCDMTTLVPQAAVSYGAGYLWADETRLGATAQSTIAGIAVNRVRTNPF